MAAATARAGVNSIWILPSAMTFVAFYKGVFEFGNFVVELCRSWLDFCRALWGRLFELAPGGAAAGVDTASGDLLTLWVTSSIAIWFFPMLTRDSTGQPKTTAAVIAELMSLPRPIARLIAFVLIALSVFVIAIPFATPPASGEASLVDVLQQSQVIGAGSFGDWLAGEGVWAAIGFVAIGAGLLSYVFFVIGPKLESATLSDAEKRDLLIIGGALWLVSAAFLLTAVVMPETGVGMPFGALMRQDAMVLSLTALIGLIAWRSALPFVQLGGLIVAIFTIDAVYRFLLDVWTSVQG